MKTLTASRAAALAALAALSLGVAACHNRLTDGAPTTTSSGAPATAPDASAQVIGTAPAQPTGDPPGTTPVDKGTAEISKEAETKTMPHEGDNHAYSSVAPDNPQKSGGSDAAEAPERKSQ
jgi:hypothetical protein